MSDRPIVVVGAGVAGLRVIEQVRRAQPDRPLCLIGDEPHLPYNRPPLSKAALSVSSDGPPLLRPADGYDGLDVDLRIGVRASELHPGAREILLADGGRIAYDQLVIATGLTPRRLEMFQDLPRIHVLRNWADVTALRADLAGARHVTVAGAGVLGAEAAATLRGLGHEVALLEAATYPLARVVGPALGAAIGALHRAHGVDLRCEAGLVSAMKNGDRLALSLADGTTLDTDVVLVATGAAPATDWLNSSGIELADGVVVDEYGRTSLDAVWAVGDVARRPRPNGEGTLRLEYWTNATETAVQVAGNLSAGTDGQQPLLPPPYFWSDQFSMKLQSVGLVAPDDELQVVEGAIGTERFLAVAHRDGLVSGIVAVNMPGQLLRSRARLVPGEPVADLLIAAPWVSRRSA